jgi:hypothetical protein
LTRILASSINISYGHISSLGSEQRQPCNPRQNQIAVLPVYRIGPLIPKMPAC